MSMDAIGAAHDDAPTTELVTGVVGDRCPNCQAPLAPDQRYCVSCGERRGRPRFAYDAAVAQSPPGSAEGPAHPRRPRFSSGATLVAGVATLLVAMGVGVLIGHDSNGGPVRAAAPQVITVGGAGTGAANGDTTSNGSGSTAKGSKKVKVTKVTVSAKTAKAATAAAGKVLGSSKNLSNNVTQKVGGACSSGAGCQNGKFTGNFFPGG